MISAEFDIEGLLAGMPSRDRKEDGAIGSDNSRVWNLRKAEKLKAMISYYRLL
jgi:hypothetical protein